MSRSPFKNRYTLQISVSDFALESEVWTVDDPDNMIRCNRERLLLFIRMEVAINERRRQRYSPASLAVVQRARGLVEKRKAEGITREEGMRAFEQNFAEITEAL